MLVRRHAPLVRPRRTLRGDALDCFYSIAHRAVRFFKIVVCLQAKPESFADAKRCRQTDGAIGGNAARTAHDLVNTSRRHVGPLCQPTCRRSKNLGGD